MQGLSGALRTARAAPLRRASGWYGAKWAEAVRAESNVTTPDDPPTAPLTENHEIGDGESDFSNFLDKHPDVSTRQAVTGLGVMLGFCYGVYRLSTASAERTTPLFVPREFPTEERDFPTWANAGKR